MSKQEYVDKQIAKYKSLKPCFCQAIQETIHFTSDGLNHLLYNRRRPRSLDERVYRAVLINYIVEVITDATTALKKFDPTISKYPLWVLEHEVKKEYNGGKQTVKVIIQKNGAGNTHFLSVMSKKCCKKDTKNPHQ